MGRAPLGARRRRGRRRARRPAPPHRGGDEPRAQRGHAHRPIGDTIAIGTVRRRDEWRLWVRDSGGRAACRADLLRALRARGRGADPLPGGGPRPGDREARRRVARRPRDGRRAARAGRDVHDDLVRDAPRCCGTSRARRRTAETRHDRCSSSRTTPASRPSSRRGFAQPATRRPWPTAQKWPRGLGATERVRPHHPRHGAARGDGLARPASIRGRGQARCRSSC